jgi:hypothetical protein
MLSLDDAFKKFLHRLELTDNEQKDISRRHTKIRELVRAGISVDRDILSGSYKRQTKTKPLKDVDIFFILRDGERDWLDRPPADVLEAVRGMLEPTYGQEKVGVGWRAVTVDFGVPALDAMTDEKVMSIDVVVGFASDGNYLIPDRHLGDWITTNPEIHQQLAIDANAAYDGRWKALVRMIKKWNDYNGRPVKPSFLLEVMALGILNRGFGGSYALELQTFFATAAERIREEWRDPARLGPPVTERLAGDPLQREAAASALAAAAETVSRARRLAQQGKNGEALRIWRDDVFGPLFPLS